MTETTPAAGTLRRVTLDEQLRPRPQAATRELIRDLEHDLELDPETAARAADYFAGLLERVGGSRAQLYFTRDGAGPYCSWCYTLAGVCPHILGAPLPPDDQPVFDLTVTLEQPVLLQARPTVVCISGSMRFEAQMREAARVESLAGRIVLMPHCNLRTPHPLWATAERRQQVKHRLDGLHLAKIDMADVVLVVAPGGYIGESTQAEIDYAERIGTPVRYAEPLEPPDAPPPPAPPVPAAATLQAFCEAAAELDARNQAGRRARRPVRPWWKRLWQH